MIEPMYDFEYTDLGTRLYAGESQFSVDGIEVEAEDSVAYLSLVPAARIVVVSELDGFEASDALLRYSSDEWIWNARDKKEKGSIIQSRVEPFLGKNSLKWSPARRSIVAMGDADTLLRSVVFHLFGFVEFIGERRNLESNVMREEVNLVSEEWTVLLASTSATPASFKTLKAEGGYRLTHVGSIQRTDGSVFTGQMAEDCLDALRYFMSFAKGAWCPPVCSVGVDQDGQRVWENWSTPNQPWAKYLSWFDAHAPQQLSFLFPGFMKRWEDLEWRDSLKAAIYWYISSNDSRRGIDAGLIHIQAGIERICYTLIQNGSDETLLKAFKKMRASDRWRYLCQQLGIPTEIPTHLVEIDSLAQQHDWTDAPHALTEMRNEVVHPERKYYREVLSAMADAWLLGEWYLELAILGVCDYSGSYSSRVSAGRYVGMVEKVPWQA